MYRLSPPLTYPPCGEAGFPLYEGSVTQCRGDRCPLLADGGGREGGGAALKRPGVNCHQFTETKMTSSSTPDFQNSATTSVDRNNELGTEVVSKYKRKYVRRGHRKPEIYDETLHSWCSFGEEPFPRPSFRPEQVPRKFSADHRVRGV